MALLQLLPKSERDACRQENYREMEKKFSLTQKLWDQDKIENKIPFELTPYPTKDFVNQHFGAGTKMQFLKGTTTLSFIYEPSTPKDKGGIIISVDSRASSGLYISSKTVLKVIPISEHILGTMAGGAADCQFWLALLSKNCKLYELENKEKITVAAASKMLQNMLYNYRGMGLSIGTMIAGYDKRGPSIYYLDSEGNRCKGVKFAVGSGQMNAYGILESFYKPKMTDQEAIDLGRKAIMHATYRDTGSGGNNNLFHVSADGWKQLDRKDVSDMYYEFMNEKKVPVHKPALA